MGKKGQTVAHDNPANYTPEANPPGDVETVRDGAVNATEADLPKDANGNVRVAKDKESKRSRFLRLRDKRMANAVKRIGHVMALANKSQYEFTDDEAAEIVAVLAKNVERVRTAFAGKKAVKGDWRM